MEVTLIRSKRRVIEPPIAKIIGSAVAVPFSDGEIDRDLHPVALRLVISENRRRRGTGVGVKSDGEAN